MDGDESTRLPRRHSHLLQTVLELRFSGKSPPSLERRPGSDSSAPHLDRCLRGVAL